MRIIINNRGMPLNCQLLEKKVRNLAPLYKNEVGNGKQGENKLNRPIHRAFFPIEQ